MPKQPSRVLAGPLLWRRSPLDQLDACPPRIGDVGNRGAGRSVLTWRLIKFDALRLDLLHERRVVLQVEADMIEHAMSGRKLRLVILGKPKLDTRQVHDRRIATGFACLPAEGLRIP